MRAPSSACWTTAVLVLFGAPVAQEDHARRAVLAALGLQQRLRAAPARPRRYRWGRPCAVRMGLHTGQILLGSLGEAQRLTYTAVGDATQHAAWLRPAGGARDHPGQCGHRPRWCTARCAWWRARPAPSRARPTPGPAYQVLGLGPPPLPSADRRGAAAQSLCRAGAGAGDPAGAADTGQQRARGRWWGSWASPAWARRGFWRNSGSAWGTRASRVLEGRCESYGQATPYLPVLDVLRHNCGITEADNASMAIAMKVHQGNSRHRDGTRGVGPVSPPPAGRAGWEETEQLTRLSPQALKARTPLRPSMQMVCARRAATATAAGGS